MTCKGLYKALSENGIPKFTTMLMIIRGLGMRLRVTS